MSDGQHQFPTVTSFDVAREAGASQSAEPRAFTPGTSITEGTRKRVLKAAAELRVPEQINPIGHDDTPQANWEIANLTTIKQPFVKFSRVTVELLKNHIKNPDAPLKIEIVDVTRAPLGTE